MKSILRLKISCLFVLALNLNNYCAKAQQIVQVINPNPGETLPFTPTITTANGLRIEVYNNGDIQVLDNFRENFSPMQIGITFGTTPGNLTGGTSGAACSTTPITGNGITTPFVSLNTFIVTSPSSGRNYTFF